MDITMELILTMKEKFKRVKFWFLLLILVVVSMLELYYLFVCLID